MQLSSAQWSIIREIAAEQARAYLDKNYKPNVQTALDLGLDQSQIDEMARITEAAARKHMKQKEGSACPTVYVPLNESQTGRYFSEIVREQRAKIDVLQARVADLKADNDRWQSQHQIAVNEKVKLQEEIRVPQSEYEVLRGKFEDDERLCNVQSRRIIELQEKNNLLSRELFKFSNPVGEASFRNHQNSRCVVNPKYQAPQELKANAHDFGSEVAFQSMVERNYGPMNDGDMVLTNGEIFTWFMGQWRRKSELEGFASAKKYI